MALASGDRAATLSALCCWLLACEPAAAPAAAGRELEPRIPGAAASADEPLSAAAEPAAQATPGEASVEPQPPVFAGTDYAQDWLLSRLAVVGVQSFQAVGSTSTVFRAQLDSAIDGAFKSVTSERPLGPTAEVAAYRLARCLHLDNVPPAISRSIPVALIEARLHPDDVRDWSAIRARMDVDEAGSVRGAMIYWVTDLSEVGLDSLETRQRAESWLRRFGEVPPERRSFAASYSTMLAFDYLIGNFDRFSGGNARGNPERTRLYMRDHDLAFPARIEPGRHRALLDRVLRVERFSAHFYAQLAALRREDFERELRKDPAGREGRLLSEAQFDGVFDRREALLSHIEALMRERGKYAVLYFP
ncbi:MAG: hypothetical protein OEZ06_09310 [Myxococcales bacterium]|nr:hypothetical protein [Myxococcales bacterium]